MKFLRRAAVLVANLWRAAAWKVEGWRRRDVKVVLVDEEPKHLQRNLLYVRQGAGRPAFGYLACPCGCGATLHLRFVGARRPRWVLSLDRNGRATLRPSVWRGTGCGSHFFVCAGRIVWC